MQQANVQIPRDAAQLSALRDRRDELSTQVEGLSDRRQKLVNERFNATVNQNPGLVGQLDAQISEISARLRRIETEKLAMDDAISAALRQGIADQHLMPVLPPTPPTPGVTSIPGFGLFEEAAIRGKYERMMFMEAIVFLLFGFMLWRWGVSRGRRQAGSVGQGDTQLRQAVDSIAIEVERISENQRYVTKLLSEQNQASPVSRPLSEAERVAKDAR